MGSGLAELVCIFGEGRVGDSGPVQFKGLSPNVLSSGGCQLVLTTTAPVELVWIFGKGRVGDLGPVQSE